MFNLALAAATVLAVTATTPDALALRPGRRGRHERRRRGFVRLPLGALAARFTAAAFTRRRRTTKKGW